MNKLFFKNNFIPLIAAILLSGGFLAFAGIALAIPLPPPPPAPSLTSATITSNETPIGDLNGATLATTNLGSCNGSNGGSTVCRTLNVASVVVANGPLKAEEDGFTLNADTAQQATLTSYFNAKGWPTAYNNQINSEITGAAPFLYFVSDGDGDYSLADGFEWGLGNQNQPLSVDDNYPAGVYTYSGTVAGNPITITLTITKLSTADDITSFGCGLTGEVDTIGAGTVGVAVPSGTDVTNLIPTIVVSAGATVAPTSGTAENFTEPVNYTVTAQDGLTNQVYTVTVTVAPAPVVPAPVSTGGGGGGGAGGNAFYYGIASSSSTSSTSSASSASFASLVSSTILTSNEESSSSSFSSSSISVQQSSSSSSSSSFSSSSVSTINNIPVGAGAAALTNSGVSGWFNWIWVLIILIILIIIYTIYRFITRKKI